MSFLASLRRRVIFYCNQTWALWKGVSEMWVFKTRVLNCNKHVPLLPDTFATLLGHTGNYYFQIFWIYSCLHVQSFQGRTLQNSSLVRLAVLCVSSCWCVQASIYKGGGVNAEFLKEPIKCRGFLVQSNEAQPCLLHLCRNTSELETVPRSRNLHNFWELLD